MLRKVNNRIYLGVFRLEAMLMLDRTFDIFFSHAMCNTLVEESRLFKSCFNLNYIKISDVGEGYIMLNAPIHSSSFDDHQYQDNVKYCSWNFDETLIKKIVETWWIYYSSFKISDMPPTGFTTIGKSTIIAANQKEVADNFKKILNAWNGTATEEDEAFVGKPLDPFKQNLIKDQMKLYNKIINGPNCSLSLINSFNESQAAKDIEELLK